MVPEAVGTDVRLSACGWSMSLTIIENAGVRSASVEVKRMEEKTKDGGSPSVLPVVQYGPTQYFVDLRLRQFRNIDNPDDCVDYDSERARGQDA